MVVGGRELIDTLWNVNMVKLTGDDKIPVGINRYIMECKSVNKYHQNLQISELIDTLWNVNSLATYYLHKTHRINRYIMECKCRKCRYSCYGKRRINRYIMECKFFINLPKKFTQFELIDTLWNVNTLSKKSMKHGKRN